MHPIQKQSQKNPDSKPAKKSQSLITTKNQTSKNQPNPYKSPSVQRINSETTLTSKTLNASTSKPRSFSNYSIINMIQINKIPKHQTPQHNLISIKIKNHQRQNIMCKEHKTRYKTNFINPTAIIN